VAIGLKRRSSGECGLNARGDITGAHSERLFPIENKKLRAELAHDSIRLLIVQGILLITFIAVGQWQLIFVVSLAPFTASWMTSILAISQHYGKIADTNDYRQSTRTVLLNPILERLYWRMNYHIEHHMYPDVPTYNLPRLHNLISSDLPPPTSSFSSLLREMHRIKNSTAF